MAENQAPPLARHDSQSEDDIDEMFKKELNRMTEGEGAEVFGGSSAAYVGLPRSTSLPGPLPPLMSTDCDDADNLNYANGDSTGKPRSNSSANPTLSSFFGTLWDRSTDTYRWTRQLLAEGFGRRSKTVDPVLHAQIVALWGTRREYRNIGKTVTTLAVNFERFMQSQRDLAGAFRFMSVQEENLVDEFVYNADMQDILYKNGCMLLATMKAFTSAIETLCNQTMVDTLWTAKQLNYARIQYDALKSELTALQSSANAKYCEVERKFLQQKQTYENLKENLKVKLKLLHDNKVSVMHRQLEAFHNAISAYFSGNQADLEASMKQFQIRPGVASSSWLEQKN